MTTAVLTRLLGPDHRARLAELARFLSVGGVAFVVDMGLFNLLRFGPGELLAEKPITAKVVSTLVATLVSWVGNRLWTFSQHRTRHRGRELLLFVVVNGLGLAVGAAPLAFSQYVLHLDGPVPDNIANLVGIALGTALRYVGYKRWVFTGEQDEVASPDERAADEAAVALAVQPVVPFGAVVAADELHEQHQHEHESH
ncbi:GtrA family protein [Cellulomonas sp. A375-1]|uniref:GtrA family protein n=1 Tax=Cellulomonas sp. A375-1 TaxID=1672219 RepID=UPI0009E42FE3|nr:GtrA family protein [Cellulomonas sp. A375-1]